ncbi:MAG: alpha-L-fucosidase [Kiritimatiellales bacterium]
MKTGVKRRTGIIGLITAGICVLLALGSLTGCKSMKKNSTTAPAFSETPEERNARMGWWRDARFGMFVHWGLYSGLAGTWNGEPVKGGGMEWIQKKVKADTATYASKAIPLFKPKPGFATEWAKSAKAAGCRYIVFTTKHHEGFALHDSAVTDFDAGSVLHRDLVREIVEACRAEGLRVGFYYSLIDWHHAQYDFSLAKGLPYPLEKSSELAGVRDHAKYIDFLHAQVNELVSNYGTVDVLWWDFSSKFFEGDSAWRATELIAKVRAAQPGIIMNNRLYAASTVKSTGNEHEEFDISHGDFSTPEQRIPENGLPGVDWESCMTMNKTWGYNEHDTKWKSDEKLIRNLIDIASKGGNYLLNVGPKGDGSLPEESVKSLNAIGAWMSKYSESIYGTSASPFKKLDWGRCTQKKHANGTTLLYLFVFDWPTDGKLVVPNLNNQVADAYLLSDKSKKLAFSDDGIIKVISLDTATPDANASVVVLEIKGEPKVSERNE